jgi:hypothetical protein
MNGRCIGTLASFLVLAFASASPGEYLIYLKGGHYIAADNCTFSLRKEGARDGDAGKDESPEVQVEDCTKGKPEGKIFWSTIDGNFGEVNADDVYAIFGNKNPAPIKSPSGAKPLEDYLITNRGESFVNAKSVEQKEERIHGIKRDHLATMHRRGVTDISPEGEARTRSGEGLCPGEPAEFSVTEVELVGRNLVGVVTNLSKAAWRLKIDVEVHVKGKRLGKFLIDDTNVLAPDDRAPIDEPVPARFLKHVERLTDPEASVRLCYRRVKTGTRQSVSEQSSTTQPGK